MRLGSGHKTAVLHTLRASPLPSQLLLRLLLDEHFIILKTFSPPSSSSHNPVHSEFGCTCSMRARSVGWDVSVGGRVGTTGWGRPPAPATMPTTAVALVAGSGGECWEWRSRVHAVNFSLLETAECPPLPAARVSRDERRACPTAFVSPLPPPPPHHRLRCGWKTWAWHAGKRSVGPIFSQGAHWVRWLTSLKPN